MTGILFGKNSTNLGPLRAVLRYKQKITFKFKSLKRYYLKKKFYKMNINFMLLFNQVNEL